MKPPSPPRRAAGFSTTDAPIKTGDTAGDFAGMRNPLGLTFAAITSCRGSPMALLTRQRVNHALRRPEHWRYTQETTAQTRAGHLLLRAQREPERRATSSSGVTQYGVNLRMTRQTGILINA